MDYCHYKYFFHSDFHWVFSPDVQIDGKKVSSIKDLIQEAQPEEKQLNKQHEVSEKLKAFLMVGVHKCVFYPQLNNLIHVK